MVTRVVSLLFDTITMCSYWPKVDLMSTSDTLMDLRMLICLMNHNCGSVSTVVCLMRFQGTTTRMVLTKQLSRRCLEDVDLVRLSYRMFKQVILVSHSNPYNHLDGNILELTGVKALKH